MAKRAIIEYDGRQLNCAEGDTIVVSRVNAEVGATIPIGTVIACVEDETVAVGAKIKKASVQARVEAHDRLPKVVTRKYRRRKSSRSQYAHRQPITRLKIAAITWG